MLRLERPESTGGGIKYLYPVADLALSVHYEGEEISLVLPLELRNVAEAHIFAGSERADDQIRTRALALAFGSIASHRHVGSVVAELETAHGVDGSGVAGRQIQEPQPLTERLLLFLKCFPIFLRHAYLVRQPPRVIRKRRDRAVGNDNHGVGVGAMNAKLVFFVHSADRHGEPAAVGRQVRSSQSLELSVVGRLDGRQRIVGPPSGPVGLRLRLRRSCENHAERACEEEDAGERTVRHDVSPAAL